VSGLLAALRYLTIVPVPGPRPTGRDALGAAAAWLPVVGGLLGLVLAAVDLVAGRIFPRLLAALLTVTAWKLLTGGLHLDGLADCLDGLVGRDAEHRLAIMRDSRIGAFGAIGLILLLLLDLVALADLPPTVASRTLIAAPVIARAMPALVARLFRTARADGHGASFRAALAPSSVGIGLAVALAVAVACLGWRGLASLAVGVAAALALAWFMARRLGGVTGDVLGATVELSELAVLLTISAWTSARP
jgi:adenosylcobinamide-GDP ribazoletransferase